MNQLTKSGSFLPSTESDLRARVTVLVEAPPGLPGLLPPSLSLARASSSSRSISASRPWSGGKPGWVRLSPFLLRFKSDYDRLRVMG